MNMMISKGAVRQLFTTTNTTFRRSTIQCVSAPKYLLLSSLVNHKFSHNTSIYCNNNNNNNNKLRSQEQQVRSYVQDLKWKSPFGHNSRSPFGVELANQVADKLIECAQYGIGCQNYHRDYCGMALHYLPEENKFIYGEADDGGFLVVKEFTDREQFVQWLSSQNDHLLSGEETGDYFKANNQRITKEGLQRFLLSQSDHTNVQLLR